MGAAAENIAIDIHIVYTVGHSQRTTSAHKNDFFPTENKFISFSCTRWFVTGIFFNFFFPKFLSFFTDAVQTILKFLFQTHDVRWYDALCRATTNKKHQRSGLHDCINEPTRLQHATTMWPYSKPIFLMLCYRIQQTVRQDIRRVIYVCERALHKDVLQHRKLHNSRRASGFHLPTDRSRRSGKLNQRAKRKQYARE